jgi:hypothetical protein
MAFTYDIATPVGQVRFLIGDTDTTTPANQLFTDEEITAMLGLLGGSIYQVAAACCEQLARRYASLSSSVKIGDYQFSGESAAKNYLDMAARFRDVEDNMPAFAIAEENLSGFNELILIRNYVLRTEF